MSTPIRDEELAQIQIADEERWTGGPPHREFARMRREQPVHWSPAIAQAPGDSGFWSVTTAEDVHTVSRDWQTYSSAQNIIVQDHGIPVPLVQAMFIGMDPPKHDRVKNLFQKGFTPKAIAAHAEEIRAITVAVLDRLEGRETCDLVGDVAQPVVSRVIGSFMGLAPEDDEPWARIVGSGLAFGDPDLNPAGLEALVAETLPIVWSRCGELIAARRAQPTDDLMSVLVHAEIDGDMLSEPEIVMGFFLLMAAGNDSTKATYCSAMRALMDDPGQRDLLLEDLTRVPGAVEEALRMFPAFAHFRRTATKDTELGGAQIRSGDKVILWYPSSNRDETRYQDPDRFDVLRNPEHQAFGAGGRHFCLGTALARLELTTLIEETLKRYPKMVIDGEPTYVVSNFANQLKTLPVRLNG